MAVRYVSLLARCARAVLADVSAGVGIIAALSLPVVIGSAGLAVDLNHGLEQRVINQRAADMAALGAAMAYKASSDAKDPNPQGVLDPTAQDIARINGLEGAEVDATLVPDFPSAGDQSVRVDVVSEVPYTLAKVLGLSGSYDVTSQSFASLTSAPSAPPFATPCILALSSGSSAISVSGGASIAAADCTVAAVGSITNNGTLIQGHDIVSGEGDITNNWGTLTAEQLRYGGDFTNPPWNTNVPPEDKRNNISSTLIDPWEGNAELADARALLGHYDPLPTLPSPTNPSTPSGADWNFSWLPSASVAGYRTGPYTGEYVVPAGNYTIGKLEIAGGIKVTFQSGSTITIANGFSNGGSSVTFGNTNLYVNGGFNSGSSGVTIGDGRLWIGSGTVSLTGTNRKGNGDVTINGTLNAKNLVIGDGNHHFGAINVDGGGSVTLGDGDVISKGNVTLAGGAKVVMGAGDHSLGGVIIGGGSKMLLGAGDFTAVSGINIAGDSELAIGDGDVLIGPSGGKAIFLDGSARLFMGDGAFSANGHIDTSGGSKIAFGRTANHYINGNMTIRGAALFGPGRYTVNGNFANGTGGTTWPYTSGLNGKTYGNTLGGESVSGFDMAGVDVTFVLAGTLNLGGGAKTKLIASSTSSPGAQIADMLLYSETSSNTNWYAGANNRFGGAVYLPNSAVTMSGGNSTLDAGHCFTLVANTITVSGGAATGSICTTVEEAYNGDTGGSATSGTIRLVK